MIQNSFARSFTRSFTVLLLLALAGCGFQLRGSQLGLDADLGPLTVVASSPDSDLPRQLARALRSAGATHPLDGEPASTLRLLVETWQDRPLTVDANVEVREFIMVYVVEFELIGPDKAVRVPRQRVELDREYTFDVTAAGGTPAERALIRDELSRDMVGALIRRLAAAQRAGI